MNHQLYLPQVNAGIFSMKLLDLSPRVLERAQSVQGLWKSGFPVKPPCSLSLFLCLSAFWHTHSDGDDWVLHRNRHFILFQKRFSTDFPPLSESLYANGDKNEPHVRLRSPAKRPGVGCTANVGMRTPFSSSLLPPFLHSLWTTPKQEVHFLFFLKKDHAASVLS